MYSSSMWPLEEKCRLRQAGTRCSVVFSVVELGVISASFYNAKFCFFVFGQEVLIMQARHNSDTHGLVCLMYVNIDAGLSD